MSLKKFFSKYKLDIILLLFYLLFLALNMFNLHNKMVETSIYGKKYYFALIAISSFAYLIVFLINKFLSKKTNLPKVFVVNAIVLGFFFIILSPMFTGSDEQNHYYRIYEIASGTLVTPTNDIVGSMLPESLDQSYNVAGPYNTTKKYRDIKDMQKIKLNKDNKVQYGKDSKNYDNTALYSPIQYFPHVIGFIIGILLNLSPMLIGILGRLFNLIFYVIIGYLCIKIIPKAKLFYLIILLSPSMLQCATTLSADAFTNIIVLLLIAIVFNIINKNEAITIKDEILIFGLSIIIALCKIVYLPIVFVILLINRKIINRKYIFCFITIMLSCVVSYLWINYTNSVFETTYKNSELQKQFIFSHLIEYGFIFVRTMLNDFLINIESLFVGIRMYHSQLIIPSFVSITYVIVVLLSYLRCNIKNKINTISKAALVIISIMVMGLISTAIYIQCTAQQVGGIGSPTIFGIQGRYFIPLVFLIPFIIDNKNRINIDDNLLVKSALFMNIITFMFMIVQFTI